MSDIAAGRPPSPTPGDERDGRSTRWDLHRRERRLAIINAAVQAIEQYGPEALTAQVAELAGVPRTHVYRHFDGKPALDLAVSTHVANSIAARLRAGLATGGSARAIIRASVDEHLGWVEEHPNLYRFLAQHAYAVNTGRGATRASDAKSVFAAELTALIERYLAALGADTAPAERVVVGVVGLVDATAAWWLERREPPRAQLTDELTDAVWLLVERITRGAGLRLGADQPLPELG